MTEQETSIMKRRLTILALTALAVAALGNVVLAVPSPALAGGATQISGIGYFDDVDNPQCPLDTVTGPEGQSPDFANTMDGDLVGCLYVFIESAVNSPSGTYRETGTETFIGSYNGGNGTFRTTYRFEAKYEDVANLLGEKVGRCQHPIVEDSGTGVFKGVSGQLNFKDDIPAGNFPYRGHLRY
jgi:hypothetical protein